jgi:hypothetical protein
MKKYSEPYKTFGLTPFACGCAGGAATGAGGPPGLAARRTLRVCTRGRDGRRPAAPFGRAREGDTCPEPQVRGTAPFPREAPRAPRSVPERSGGASEGPSPPKG